MLAGPNSHFNAWLRHAATGDDARHDAPGVRSAGYTPLVDAPVGHAPSSGHGRLILRKPTRATGTRREDMVGDGTTSSWPKNRATFTPPLFLALPYRSPSTPLPPERKRKRKYSVTTCVGTYSMCSLPSLTI